MPASIKVAPNSPNARVKDRIVPAKIPGHAKGNIIFQKSRHSDAPNVRPALNKFVSICSKAPKAVLYIKGNATTVAVMTVAGHEKIILMFIWDNICPTGPFFPKSNSNKNPTTVGGNTKGDINIPSMMGFAFPRYCSIHFAVVIPRKKVIIVAVVAVLKDIHRGEKSS